MACGQGVSVSRRPILGDDWHLSASLPALQKNVLLLNLPNDPPLGQSSLQALALFPSFSFFLEALPFCGIRGKYFWRCQAAPRQFRLLLDRSNRFWVHPCASLPRLSLVVTTGPVADCEI